MFTNCILDFLARRLPVRALVWRAFSFGDGVDVDQRGEEGRRDARLCHLRPSLPHDLVKKMGVRLKVVETYLCGKFRYEVHVLQTCDMILPE